MEILAISGRHFLILLHIAVTAFGGQLLRREQRRAGDSGLIKGFRQPYVAHYLPNTFEESPVVLLYACAADSKIR